MTLDSPRLTAHAGQRTGTTSSASRAQELSQLIGEIYEGAPQATRNLLIEYLMRPLGLLGLVTVANGVFLKSFIDHGLSASFFSQVATHIQVSDVIALADRVQQVNVDAIASAIHLISLWPAPID